MVLRKKTFYKTGENNLIQFFKALLIAKVRFLSVHFFIRTLFACVILSLVIGSHTALSNNEPVYEPYTNQTYEYHNLTVHPSIVSSVGWQGDTHALSYEYGNDALFDAFKVEHAAILQPPQKTESVEEHIIDIPTEVVAPDTEESDGTDALIEAGDDPSPVPPDGDNASPSPSPSLDENISEPLSVLDTLERSVYRITEKATGLFRFAQESVITEGTSQSITEQPAETHSDSVDNVVEAVPDQIDTSSDIPLVTESHDENIDTSSEESNAVYSTSTDAILDEALVDTISLNSESEANALDESMCAHATCTVPVMEFSGFEVGTEFDEEKITNMQLRLSLAARPHADALPGGYLKIEYEHYDYWIDGGVVLIDDEISNALNGGYQLFAFPLYSDWDELKRIKVRISYIGDREHVPSVFVDGVWLEIESIHNNAFIDPLAMPPKQEDLLENEYTTVTHGAPEEYLVTLTSDETEFEKDEHPQFEFTLDRGDTNTEPETVLGRVTESVLSFFGFHDDESEESFDEVRVEVVDEEFEHIAEVETHDDGTILVNMPKQREFTPGVHTMTIEVQDGDTTFFIEQEFAWGVLALNADKTMYLPDEEAYVQMGVLDDAGHTICDAELLLKITSPTGNITELKTTDGSINYGDECAGDTYTTSPDYDTRYTFTDNLGIYHFELTAITKNGTHTITDEFEVRDSVPFDIVRAAPSRIYPIEEYPVTLTITANEAYTGHIIESVPQSFQITGSNLPYTTYEVGDTKQIIWNISLTPSTTQKITYTFDAPDVSPEFYLLGPLEIGTFKERREWQVASDAPGNARIVQSVLGTVSSATSYSATFGAAPTAGNTIIMVATHRDGANAFTAPAFLSQAVLSNASVEEDIGIWYGAADPATSTYSISKTGGNQSGVVYLMEVSGLETTSLLSATSSNDQTGTTGLVSWTGLTPTTTQYAFVVAASIFGDNDFTDPTSASWTSSSTASYTQQSWNQWATGNDGGLGIATANARVAERQQARLVLTTGGVEDRNSVIAAFRIANQVTTISSRGNQSDVLKINSQHNNVGGVFTLTPNTGSSSVTGITISESGTTNAQTDLSNIRLRYELDSTTPYDCASATYDGTETQYGATSSSFTAANGSATFNGSVSISTTSVMCLFTVLDIDSSATPGDTLEIEISTPNTQVTMDQGSTTPGTAVSLSNTTVLQIGFVPSASFLTATPTFPFYYSTSTQPRIGGFYATDTDADVLEYEFTIDDDPLFASPATTTYSTNYPNDAGWASTTFSAGATTTYQVPSGILTPGQTYWWRVRARDVYNRNEWGGYSPSRSLTIGSGITVPEWFQTTDYQFSTSTSLTNATTTGGGSLNAVNLSTSVSLLNAWSVGTTKVVSAGSNRMLVVAIASEDAGTDTDVNQVSYGGQVLTEIYDQQIGLGPTNALWMGYLNDAGITAATNTTISVTWNAAAPDVGSITQSAVYADTNQTAPIRDFSTNAITTGSQITPSASTTVVTGDVSVYAVTSGQNRTYTAATGYTEGTDSNVCGGGTGCSASAAYKLIGANGTELPTAVLSASTNRVLITEVVIKPTPATGIIMSPEIDFDWVSGQTDWGEVAWSVTEGSGNSTVMKVYYSSTTVCDTIVPNGALPSNSTGFSTTSIPLDISALATSTYNRICLQMTLSEGSGSSSPLLNDWTVRWDRTPVFTQSTYRWYANSASATPTDVWPPGTSGTQLNENESISATDPIDYGQEVRLRMNVAVSSVAASGRSFKLQFAEADTCSASLDWIDVGAVGSTTALWRGYDNTTLTDGATLASSTLSNSTVFESYEESNNTATMPNSVSVSGRGEWDWVLEHNATSSTEYCFRMVNSDGSPFTTYTNYPELITNESSTILDLAAPFDNEKVASTSPWFDFIGIDAESDSIEYQIQVDNNADFSSTVVDTDSASNLTDFTNSDVPADKSPFNAGDTIRYKTQAVLTNNATYWWRVRGRDTDGSAQYGAWSSPQSFTITTGTAISTWFQTTEAQFDTDALEDTDATTTDIVTILNGSSVGTTTGTTIDFDDATIGNAWGELSWTDTGAANSILYRVQYNDGDSWEFIPDSALSGNSAGFDSSPVSLIDLDTQTYNEIRVVAVFMNATPTLLDWTVVWGQRVSVPTHLLLFDNEKQSTTSPSFTFYTTDPDDDDLEYEFSISTDNTFTVGTSTFNSSTSPGFVNVTTSTNTTPFISGDTIRYTIQTPLSGSSTYWWRVRARDPNDGNAFSFWSDPWSFTHATSATTSTWFQTTQEQFETDTLFGLVASTSDAVTITPPGETVYNFSGITAPSLTHVGRDFEVDVQDPTDPPTVDEIDSLTTTGTTSGTPNLRTAIAGYASDAEATNVQYTALAASDNTRWQITDPGAGDNAIFWASFVVTEDPADITSIEVNLEGYQAAAVDKAWLGIWRPGSTTPYWELLESSQRTSDYTYSATLGSNLDEYVDGSNRIHVIFFNVDDSDSLFVDYVEVRVTTGATDSGSLTSTSLDFDDGSGPAWGELSWTDSEPGFSSITYHLEYLTGAGTWADIPNAALSGNETGFSTSPVVLTGLNTTTYNEIRIVADFSCVLAVCPTLQDWTLKWSPGFTVSGTAFEYDGVSSTTAGTVRVAVDGVLQTNKTGTISNGAWSINNVTFFDDDIVTVFVDGVASDDEAVGVTKFDGSPDISGMRLQKRHLSIGSDDNETITNTDLNLYDFTQDEDIFFNVDSGSDLTLCADTGCGDASMRIRALNTFSPGSGADVTTHDLLNDGTFTSGANTIRVSGSWDNNATTTLTGSTVIFTATSSSETLDETGALTPNFNNITFGESSGTATWTPLTNLDVNGNLSVTFGTFARGTTSLTIAGNLTTGAAGYWTGIGTTTYDGTNPSTWTDSNSVRQNIGNVVVDGTAKSLFLGSSTTLESLLVGADDTFDVTTSGHAVRVWKDWIIQGTFLSRTGTVHFLATTTGRTITAGSDAFNTVHFNGIGGAWSWSEADLTVNNDFLIATGTVTLPTGTTTITGSFLNTGGTFMHNNGTFLMNTTGSKQLTLSGSGFVNALYNIRFTGSGSWTFTEVNATTSNDLRITQGTVTFPSGIFALGGHFENTAGSFTHNSGTLRLYGSSPKIIDANSSFFTLLFARSTSTTFVDSAVTAVDDLTILSGEVVMPTGTFTIGGSLTNNSTLTHSSGTVLMNSTDTGETISLGSSSLHNFTFNSGTGGWTISSHATTTGTTTLTSVGSFVLGSGQTLSVASAFVHNALGASTTWTGSTLSLEAGSYSINQKTSTGDTYDTLRIKSGAHVALWNSSAAVYDVQTSASLYSQDHGATDGDLYIFGDYQRTSGTEYWNYATDFDGTSLGTTSRQVDVRVESDATIRISNAVLSVTGTGTASSTVRNQGSGTYTINVSGGTTTAQYYDIGDLGLTGITLGTSTKVSTLSDGRVIPSTHSGTGITVDAQTVDANPALQIFRVDFSTTTLIAASNVTQTGGAPTSYWWFRSSTGTTDGEGFDADTGDPGSIRWDDSSLSITVSGIVYDDNGTSPLGAPTCGVGGTPVRVVVENGTSYDGACDGSGVFSIPGVTIVGDPTLTVFLNGAGGGERAVTVTKTPTTDIVGLPVISGRVLLRHEDTSPMTILDMMAFDSGDDTDIPYAAATGTLIVEPSIGLQIAQAKTFTPDGEVTLQSSGSGDTYDGSLYLSASSTFTGSGTTTYSIGGSLFVYASSTFVPASTTVQFTSTTTGRTIVSSSSENIALHAVSFTGVGGGWNLNGNIRATGDIHVSTGTLSGTGNITLTSGSLYGDGTVSLGSGTTTLMSSNTLGGTTAWTFAHLTLGTGSTTGTTTKSSVATTTVSGVLTIGTAHYFNARGSILNLTGSGTVFVESGTFVESTSTVRYSGTAGSNVLGTTYYNLDIHGTGGTPTYTATGLGVVVSNGLSIGGTVSTTFTLNTNDPALDVNGNLNIYANGIFIGSNSASATYAGNWDNNGTFTGSGGTTTFDGSGVHTIAPGSSSFSNLVVQGTGDFTVNEAATTTGVFRLVTANDFRVNPGLSFAVGGSFSNLLGGTDTTWTGSILHLYGGNNYTVNSSSTSDTYETLTVNGSTHIRLWNSSASSTDLASTASVYSQDHGGVNGDLYVFGAYVRTSGDDYWSYARDFDGTLLTSGNERQVDVRIASGGSILYTGGGLAVMGTSTASTSIANQGSGTYSIRIGGTASTTFSFYDMSNMDASGLTFSGSPTVINISNGSFTVGVASGTAITVGGTAITQNPAKTFSANSFGTSTGGLAFNVTATGTTVSSWRFTNHSGVIDGENYDVDPNGDPGYVVWDDSAALLTLSGNVYSDEGTTASGVCDGSTNITLRVAGLTTYQTSCNGSGFYTINNVSYSPGDSFVIYIDGETEKGAVVSEDPVTSVANLDIYENRVIVRHEGSDPLSIADMSLWDSSDDVDIPFTAIDSSPDTLTLPLNTKLLVWDSKEFEPNGNVTVSGGGGGASYDGTLELQAGATFDATGSESHAIGGSLIVGTSATFDDETSTITFTTTGASRTIDTNGQSFYNLTLNGSGSWVFTDSTLSVGNTFTLAQGSTTLPVGTTTVSGSFINSGGSFNQNGGWMYFDGSGARTIMVGSSAFGTTTFNGSGSWTYVGAHATSTGHYSILSGTVSAPTGTLTIGGNFTNNSTFTHNSGTIRMTSPLASTTLFASSSDFGSVAIAGTGTFIFTDSSEALAGTLSFLSGTTTLPTTTLSIGGSFLNTGGAFIHSTGTVLFNSSDTGELVTFGTSSLSAVTFASPSGGWTITDSGTTTANFTLSSASAFALASGQTLAVQGVFTNTVGGGGTTWTGSTLRILTGSNYTVNSKTLGGDVYNIITLGNNTDLRLWNSSATTTIEDSLSSLYSQNNAAVNGELYIYGNYERTTGADYWSAITDFDGSIIASRAVTVRHAANATSTFSGGTLEIVGTASATTTITHQGTSTYAWFVSGGTLNAQYYAIRNIDANGLVLSGTTTVTSLQYGDFELAVSGGTLLTVSSTTLNYNASAVISGVRFATATAITGTNIALVGTTSSAWTFTSHRGNLDGEAFDSDGIDACGSVRWDDSSCLLTEQSAYRWRNDDGGEGVPDSEWYDLSWSKRKRVTVTNLDATAYTDAVVEITLPYDSDMQTDFDDLRVTDSSGTTSLNFAREIYTASSEVTLWVKIPTFDASESVDVYVYYGNGGASYGGVGTTTFAVFDDFEDDTITEYSGDTSLFDTDTTFAYQGTYGLEVVNPSDRATDGIFRTSASSTLSQGQTIRFFQYVDTSAGSGDETCTLFGVQSPGTANNNYAVCLEQFGTDRVSISENVDDNDTSGTILASTTITYTTGWYEVEVDWTTSNLIYVSVYKDDVLVATTSATDSTYTTGGFGFTFWFQNGGWDYFTSRTLLTTEPTTTIGYEQVSGGASWAAALNTALPGAEVGEVVRPRFLIENTGLTVNDSYRLMYAVKGASPSCESVSSGSYTAVPVQSSCGSSPICMQTSSQFTNNADTTDLLGGEGVFTPGEIIEDPSNTTNATTLNAGEYTEVEYAIVTTATATSPAYCLRVSDAGTAIDSYTRVAELGLTFEPTISSITFNDGNDISLTPGATTTIYATGTVSDLNGYADIAYATTTMYRSGVGQSCTADTNNCYFAGPSRCSFTNCGGNSCDVVCSADFYYFADPTDTGSAFDAQSWGALLTVEDQSNLVATQTAPFVDLLTLRAFDTDSLISYGTLEVLEDTGAYNATTTFVNLGNDAIDIAIEGSDLSDGLSSTIPVTEQQYATSTFTYSACTYCSQLTASSTVYELDLLKPTTTSPQVSDQVFWGIAIPFGVSGNTHTGANIFYATGD